ncbi:hypothetical protein ES703_29313 [subsurface metagenome]
MVAQLRQIEVVAADAGAERRDQRADLLGAQHLVEARALDIEDLAAQGQHGLEFAVASLLGAAAGRVALDDEKFGAVLGAVGAVGELTGQAQLLHRGLARDFLLGAAAQPLLGAFGDEVEQLVGLQRVAGQPVIEGVLDGLLDDALGLGGGKAVLGLALEFRLAHEHAEHAGGAHHHVIRGDGGGALALADALGVVLQAAQQRAAHAGFMRAAIGRRHGVGVGRQEAVGIGGPRDGPFAGAMRAVAAGLAGEDVGMHQRVGVNGGGEIILQAAGEVEFILGGDFLDALEQLRRALPADFDAAEQIGLRARHLEQALRLEGGLGAEDIGVRLEADARAAAVVDLAEVLELALRVAAFEAHAIEFLAARDFDLGVEFAARMQRAHDDFERRLLREFGMGIDGDATAVVGDGQEAVGGELHLDEVGMAGQRLVHGVVDDFGEQVVQRLLVGAADIHARPSPYRLQALEHLDVAGGIAVLGAAPGGDLQVRLRVPLGFRLGSPKEVVVLGFCC